MSRNGGLALVLMTVLGVAGGVPQALAQTEAGRDSRQLELQVTADNQAPAMEADAAIRAERPVRTPKRTTQAQREAAAARAKAARKAAPARGEGRGSTRPGLTAAPRVFAPSAAPGPGVTPTQGGVPDLFGTYANWANSPRNMRKFVDTLPGLTIAGSNNLKQYIPVANPDIVTYPGSDYYEISLVQYSQQMHSDLPVTPLRGYVQTNNGTDVSVCVAPPTCTVANNTKTPSPVMYLGPVIVAQKNRPVRIKFTNNLATGAAGKLFVPVDVTAMGSGPGPDIWTGVEDPVTLCASAQDQPTPAGCYTQNRAAIHLHGGKTPWISDGTPHQWITPAGETTSYPRGESVENVPDMPDPGPGSQTFYFTNQQSARLMFYHDHASGITRLNVYAGGAAGYVITDPAEAGLVSSGAIPPAADTIPLIIQDKTFVDAASVLSTDPTWNWGTGALNVATGFRAPRTGDLWWPHVYVPGQNPYDMSGVNPWGRWAYGPWFYPPTSNIQYPPVPNPYYDPTCDPFVTTYCEPPMMPGAPKLSLTAESFMDTPVVNGTAYPALSVDPKPYRFRILNAAGDRFWNLQLYKADPATKSSDNRVNTEVKMAPAITTAGWPAKWPTDGRPNGVPDPATVGPSFIQIGTEGGFLPKPAIVPNQPIAWNMNPSTFNFGNVSDHALLLGPAERADVIVDFSAFAGQTLILYNDAPAPFPALDPRMDYYAGAPDMRDTGGSDTPQVGFGPNTRTILQIKVNAGAGTPFNMTTLNTAWTNLFATAQEPILVGQPAYNGVYAANPTFPYFLPPPAAPGTFGGVSRIQDNTLNFETVGAAGTVLSIPMQPKSMHDEMGAVYDEYGRMSAKLGLEVPFTTNLNATFIMKTFADPATEIVAESVAGVPTAGDGTQIWKISHNGVDTHPIHFHIFDVQLINRVGWDGAIRLPDANELGWKDTIRISPLEDTIVALRPVAPKLPFGIPDSIRRLNPALPDGAIAGFSNQDQFGQPLIPATVNALTNFGWEYVWHCHILGHEEADMMRPIVLGVARALPAAPVLSRSGITIPVDLAWTDATPVGPNPSVPLNLGNPANETGFRIERATVVGGVPGAYSQIGVALANQTKYSDSTASAPLSYNYRVVAFNAAGTRTSNVLFVQSTTPSAPSGLAAVLQAGPQVRLTWTDNSNNETGFTIQRASNNTFTTGLTSFNVGANITTYTDNTGLVSGSTYYYRLIAVNGAVQSLPSNVVLVTAGLAAPSNLTATAAAGPLRVTLNWTDNSTTETSFTIERACAAAFSSSLVSYSAGANVTTYLDTTNLATGYSYYFRVRAEGPGGPSAWSNTASVGPPAAPTGASAVRGSGTSIIFGWTDNATNETGFRIERSVDGGAFILLSVRPPAAGTAERSYTDLTTTAGHTYTYRVLATGVLGNSAWATSAPLLIP